MIHYYHETLGHWALVLIMYTLNTGILSEVLFILSYYMCFKGRGEQSNHGYYTFVVILFRLLFYMYKRTARYNTLSFFC